MHSVSVPSVDGRGPRVCAAGRNRLRVGQAARIQQKPPETATLAAANVCSVDLA
jgi:hypothetical protein